MNGEAVSTLIDVLQLSPAEAQFLLRVRTLAFAQKPLVTDMGQKYNNDTSRAIQEYFEHPNILHQAVSHPSAVLSPHSTHSK